MGAEAGLEGRTQDGTNRAPLWEAGFDVRRPLYTYIRTLAWLRRWLNVTAHTQIGARVGGAARGARGAPRATPSVLRRCWAPVGPASNPRGAALPARRSCDEPRLLPPA